MLWCDQSRLHTDSGIYPVVKSLLTPLIKFVQSQSSFHFYGSQPQLRPDHSAPLPTRTSTTNMNFFLPCSLLVFSATMVLPGYILHSLARMSVTTAVGVFFAFFLLLFFLGGLQVAWIFFVVCWWWRFGLEDVLAGCQWKGMGDRGKGDVLGILVGLS